MGLNRRLKVRPCRVRAQAELGQAAQVDDQRELPSTGDAGRVALDDLLVQGVAEDGQDLAQLRAVQVLHLVEAHQHEPAVRVCQPAQLHQEPEHLPVRVRCCWLAQLHPAADHGESDLLDALQQVPCCPPDGSVEAVARGDVPQPLGQSRHRVLARREAQRTGHQVPPTLRRPRDPVHQDALADARLAEDRPSPFVDAGLATCGDDRVEVGELRLRQACVEVPRSQASRRLVAR